MIRQAREKMKRDNSYEDFVEDLSNKMTVKQLRHLKRREVQDILASCPKPIRKEDAITKDTFQVRKKKNKEDTDDTTEEKKEPPKPLFDGLLGGFGNQFRKNKSIVDAAVAERDAAAAAYAF